ncbi:hypothetical protein Goari_019087, partial [Gossypium aridum]|nr:hypothetical protein [Gossypium aridum]
MMRSTDSAMKTECNLKSAQQFGHNGKGDKSKSHCRIQRLKAYAKVKALERASNTFKSENPFFLVAMYPSYVDCCHDKRCRLAIPCNFVKENLMKKHWSVILCNSSGKTWIATFKQGKIGKKPTSYLIAACGTFARDNNIQVGDVCAFELINSIDIAFKAVTYQGQHANGNQSLAATNVFHLVKQKAPSYASQGCPEPLTALEKAKAFQMAGSYVFLCNGWHRFAVDNNLEVGDVCVFELTGGIETSMKVTIYKKQAIEDENLGS